MLFYIYLLRVAVVCTLGFALWVADFVCFVALVFDYLCYAVGFCLLCFVVMFDIDLFVEILCLSWCLRFSCFCWNEFVLVIDIVCCCLLVYLFGWLVVYL